VDQREGLSMPAGIALRRLGFSEKELGMELTQEDGDAISVPYLAEESDVIYLTNVTFDPSE
jgi:hypothetical protein